jgi:HTH-type transcriptional repressor of NAD biosynthesis genes
MRRGLVLGKFAPLHRGHQHLIATARAAVDELVVAVYETAWYDAVSPPARARWIEDLHPGVEVVLLPDLPPDSYDESTATAAHARQLEAALGRFTDVFTSEPYGDELAALLGATHTPVDPQRRRFPVSGTALREGPAAARPWLDPLVWRALLPKVVFLGAESTGKTTLARVLAERHGTAWVPEYGRELWEAKLGALAFEDLERIAREQLARELRHAQEATGVLFCDTNAVATELWSRRLFGRAAPGLVRLAAETAADYMTFLCENDFGWVDDGTRETARAQAGFQRLVREDLDARGLPYVTLGGTLEQRAGAVETALAQAGWKSRPLTSFGKK